MMRVVVLTKWNSDLGGNRTCDVASRHPGAWTDITGQPDTNLPSDINVTVWLGDIDDATLPALEADNALVVLIADMTDAEESVVPRGPKSSNANPTAAQRTALNAWLNAQGVTGPDRAALVIAGRTRGTTADAIRAWAKARPKARPKG